MLEDSKVTEDVLINNDSTNTLVSDREFIQDFEDEDVNIGRQVLSVSLFEEKNVMKASFEEISNEHDGSNEEVHFVLDLSFLSNNMIEIVQEAQVEETSIILEDNFSEIIDMIMPTCIEDKKVVLEEQLAQNEKLNEKYTKQTKEKVKRKLLMVGSNKLTSFRRAITKSKKKLKFWYFRVSRKVDAKSYMFAVQDYLLFYYKFHLTDCLLFAVKLEESFFPKRRRLM